MKDLIVNAHTEGQIADKAFADLASFDDVAEWCDYQHPEALRVFAREHGLLGPVVRVAPSEFNEQLRAADRQRARWAGIKGA